MNFRKLLINSIILTQILLISNIESSWWNKAKKDVKDFIDDSSSTKMLTRKLKHTKISTDDKKAYVIHLRHIIDEALNHGKVKISVQDNKLRITGQQQTHFVKLPEELRSSKAPYTLWYMEHGEHDRHSHHKAYTKVQLPVTLELKK